MPDVNLLQNNKEPQEPKAPKSGRPDVPLSDPGVQKGIGNVFRSLFSKKVAEPEVKPASLGAGTRGQQRSTERILSEKRTNGPIVQLPESDQDFQVNLLSEDVVSHINPRQKFLQLGFVAAGAIIFVVLVGIGLSFYQQNADKDLQATRQQVATETAAVTKLQAQAEDIRTVTDRVAAIKTLLDNHVYWTAFFTRLEKYTLRSVSFGSNFSGTLQGGISLAAKTSSYEEVAKQYLLLQQAVQAKDFISSFSMTGATKKTSKEGSEVNFTVEFVLVPSAFHQIASSGTGGNGQTTDAQSILYGVCYLAAHPEAVTLLPAAIQSAFSNVTAPQTQSACQAVSPANLQAGKDLITTDTDNDGLNNFLELEAGTSNTKNDTNNNGTPDLQDILACQNPVTTGAIANCDPSNPMANLLKPI